MTLAVEQGVTPAKSAGTDQYTITNALPNSDFEQLSQEFQLLGSTDTLNWVGGLFYYQDESEEDNNNGDTFFSESVAKDLIADNTKTKNTSIAAFGQATWTPPQLERWHFALGARYSDDNRKADRDGGVRIRLTHRQRGNTLFAP